MTERKGVAIVASPEEVQEVATTVDLSTYLEAIEEVLDKQEEG